MSNAEDDDCGNDDCGNDDISNCGNRNCGNDDCGNGNCDISKLFSRSRDVELLFSPESSEGAVQVTKKVETAFR